MKVTLRQRASNKTDRITLYLEIYKGYTKGPDNKLKHHRDYEYLDYYLHANAKTPLQKQHNKEHLKSAEAVKAQRVLEIQNGNYGFANVHRLNANFIEYFKKLTEDRLASKGNYGNWDSTLKHLEKYKGGMITFKEITPEYIEGFKDYLLRGAKMKSGKGLSTNAALSYFNKFRAALNQAYDDQIINDNPAKRVKGIKQAETHREYLTMDELKSLENEDCRYEMLKRAFLFSCFTGLRWSDVQKIAWSNVKSFDGGYRLEFTQTKTKGVEYLDIHASALKYLGERSKDPNERIFAGLKYSSYMNVALTQWMLKAGITKAITFHCARHSFATILLTKGVDIYTVSKMLGHRELKTTQIYTKVIDQKKRDAVRVFDEMLA